jgi:hypothetical protein
MIPLQTVLHRPYLIIDSNLLLFAWDLVAHEE